MSKIKSTSPYLVRQVNSTNDRENGSEEVLKIYTTTVKFSLEEHQVVFDAEVCCATNRVRTARQSG